MKRNVDLNNANFIENQTAFSFHFHNYEFIQDLNKLHFIFPSSVNYIEMFIFSDSSTLKQVHLPCSFTKNEYIKKIGFSSNAKIIYDQSTKFVKKLNFNFLRF